MTWFTDSPFEKMMVQKPSIRRQKNSTLHVPRSPACTGCPYNKGLAPCIYCMKKLRGDK